MNATTPDLTTRILRVLTDAAGEWVGPDHLIAVADQRPVIRHRHRHELDDADFGETMAFGDDATGATAEVRPDRKGLAAALADLEAAGRIEATGAAFGRIHSAYRIADADR